MSTLSDDALIAELDETHATAKRAFVAKDIAAYQDCFTSDLQYTQPDGRVIGRGQLMSDVRKQFARVHSCSTEYHRQSFSRHSDHRVTELLSQSAWIELRVFVFFTKRWQVERKGEYTLRKDGERWRIEKVVVLSEDIT